MTYNPDLMDKKDAAYNYLSKDKIRNSYLIAGLEDREILIDDLSDPRGVMIHKDEVISMRGDTDVTIELLKRLDPGEYHFHSIDPATFEAAERYVESIEDRPTWMLFRPKEAFGTPEQEVDKLISEDASVIDQHWGLGEEDSTDYIRSRIEEGPGYGIRQDGELVGWVLTHYITDSVMCLGFLHVKEGWRRKGFAKDLTEAICKEAEEKDLIPVVDIFQNNVASLSLSKSLGFDKIGENHWFKGVIPD